MKLTGNWRRTIQVLIVITIFFFLGRSLYQNWTQLSAYQWGLKYTSLSLAFLLLFINFLLIVFGWNLTLKRLGGRLSFKKSMKAWFSSQLGKYVPGKIWLVVGRVYLCEKEGIPKAVASVSVFIELLLVVMAALLIFLLSLPFWRNLQLVNRLYPLLLIPPIGFVLLHPSVFRRILGKFIRNEPNQRLKYKDTLTLLGLYLATWLLYGLAFYFLINSVHPVSIVNLPALTGIFAISWTVGFLSFLTPGGLGVREGAATLLLSLYFPLPIATVISLMSRIWMTVGEVICILVSMRF